MGFIPRITCRRCGREFSGIRSRCPYCGTRRVKQSDRVPAPTPGMNPGTPAARRAGNNMKWQMIFAAILLAVVILAVIVLVSSNLNDAVKTTPVPTLPAVTYVPTPTPDPTPTPTPAPTVTAISLTFYGEEYTATDFTIPNVGGSVQFGAQAYPKEAQVTFTWSSSDESKVTVSQDGLVTAVAPGSATITVSYGDVKTEVIARVRG